MTWLWLAVAALFLVAAASVWFAFHDPAFVFGLVSAAVAALLPPIVKAVKPKDFTEAQKELIREGRNPFQQGREK